MHQVRTHEKGLAVNQEEALTWQGWHLVLGLPWLQSCEKEMPIVCELPSYGARLSQPRWVTTGPQYTRPALGHRHGLLPFLVFLALES